MKAFFAYPSEPPEVGVSIETFVKANNLGQPYIHFKSWKSNDIPGRCLVDPIIERIKDADFIAADVTRLNFNVTYEIGFAIGLGKRVILTINKTIESQADLRRQVGIFDTLGFIEYQNNDELLTYFSNEVDLTPFSAPGKMNMQAPVYIILPREQTESETRMISRLKKVARLNYRSYDPSENPRLSARAALKGVNESCGVIIPLVPSTRIRAKIHNLRAAFVAGLSHSTQKETIILQPGDDPIPLDYRDFVASYGLPNDIDPHIAVFAPRVAELLQAGTQGEFKETSNPLDHFFLGESAAENEFRDLGEYYLQVAQFSRVLNEEVQIVAGRKGSGKSALFFQLRDNIRRHKQNVVIDLNPDGFQLIKLKSIVIERLEKGTREHTITAFWEYMLLLEICYKILEKDHQRHQFDHSIRDNYLELRKTYGADQLVSEGDFAERLLLLTEKIQERVEEITHHEEKSFLSRSEITQAIYSHDLPRLKELLTDYLSHKKDLWILFDNLDKGWSADGVSEADLLLLRCLIEALRKIQRLFRRYSIHTRGVVFIRNDVFELLVASTSDRGKIAKVTMEWDDPDLLRELIRKRLLTRAEKKHLSFEEIWRRFVVSHLSDGQETSEFAISRSLLRPRCLIDFLTHAKSHAMNLGRSRVEESDLLWAEKYFSTDLIHNLELEIADIFPDGTDCLYAFLESQRILDKSDLKNRINKVIKDQRGQDRLQDLLIWYGFLGLYRRSGEETYIYNVNYEMRKMKALIEQRPDSDVIFCINLAFCRGLDIDV